MRSFLAGLADLVFPPRCASCSGKLEDGAHFSLCEGCRSGIGIIHSPLCTVCGEPFASDAEKDHPCGSCLVGPPPFATARSLGRYDGVLMTMIHRLKYREQSRLAEPLGRLLAAGDYPGLRIGEASLVIPVPLHPRRLRQRGFNQSLLLAKAVGKSHGIPVDARSLRKPVASDPQVSLGRRQRERNVRGVFVVADAERIKGKGILLVDDVYTTGSTLKECARVLLRAGAREVSVLTLARSVENLHPPGEKEETGGRET
ncbi:MAG: amidophosphoribosyltransferase [Deltaproteobacteria bacterium HGW-Deltaproteobacteria-19]|nr:MAG: amidophosphoribosyltransferase [Deltaproteobacteria bacterium HGW-Deltaproteobacteria-19]